MGPYQNMDTWLHLCFCVWSSLQLVQDHAARSSLHQIPDLVIYLSEDLAEEPSLSSLSKSKSKWFCYWLLNGTACCFFLEQNYLLNIKTREGLNVSLVSRVAQTYNPSHMGRWDRNILDSSRFVLHRKTLSQREKRRRRGGGKNSPNKQQWKPWRSPR